MSSKYNTMNALVKGRKMSSINFVKVARAFVNPNGMTSHSKRPPLGFEGNLPHVGGFDGHLVITGF